MRWRATAAVSLACLSLAVGCGDDSGGKGSTRASRAPATETVTVEKQAPKTDASTSPDAASPQKESSAAEAGSPRPCSTSRLRITVSGREAGLGHAGFVLRFRNRGRRCVLRGYPGVDGVRSGGKVVVHARRTKSGYLGGARGGSKAVSLRRGRTASALLEGLVDQPGGKPSCRDYRYLLITPPNETHSVRRRARTSLCKLEIHPVIPGKKGSNR